VTFETNDNYSIRFEMKKHYLHSTRSQFYLPKFSVKISGNFLKKLNKFLELTTVAAAVLLQSTDVEAQMTDSKCQQYDETVNKSNFDIVPEIS